MEAELQLTNRRFTPRRVLTQVEDVLEHGDPVRDHAAEAVQKVAAAGRDPDWQPRRPPISELQQVIQRNQIKVVVRVKVRDGDAVEQRRRHVQRNLSCGPWSEVHDHRRVAMPHQVPRVDAARVGRRRASAQDRQCEGRHRSSRLC
jgi:hypothetical protein